MSLLQTVDLAIAQAHTTALVASGIDPCLVENATKDTADGLMANLTNFMYGTGLTIVLIVATIGVLMFIFGKGRWLKAAGFGILLLMLLPAIIQFAEGAVPNSGC